VKIGRICDVPPLEFITVSSRITEVSTESRKLDMTTITFIDSSNKEINIDARNGESLMEAAVAHGIESILAECGGACSCGTYHVNVDEDFQHLTGSPGELESALLEFSESRREGSRLSCQIKVTADLEGLRVHLPKAQY